MAANADDSTENQWAIELAQSISSLDERNAALEFIERSARARRGERDPRAKRADARQIYENMATSVGIDLKDPRDPRAILVNIAIRDLDPSRVLRQCRHFFGWLGLATPIALQLRLPTAGTKVLHCLRHGYTVEGMALDSVYSSFKRRHCDSCPDREARPREWEWTEAWQKAENEAHGEIVKRWREAVMRDENNKYRA